MAPHPPTPARAELRWWAWFLGTWLLFGVVGTLQVALAMHAKVGFQWSYLLAGRGLMLLSQALLFPLLWALRRGLPAGTVRPALAGAVALAALVLLATRLERALGAWLVPDLRTVGLGAKLLADFTTCALALAVATAADAVGRARERDHRALQLEAGLAEARLQALSAQLQPHFLFNTLGAISTMVHRDPAGADAMLTQLAGLLRASLLPGHHEVPLREELALLERYVAIMRVRYGPRLTLDVSVPEALGDVLVPPLLLQPLVENALEHGLDRRRGPGRVALRAERVGERLRLEVLDDGPGPAPGRGHGGAPAGRGVGLSNTRLRLEQLYGAEQRLELAQAPGAGARVTVELPARRAPAGPRAQEAAS